MRTVGTFKQVYEVAKSYVHNSEDVPRDPMVRLERGVWMIEASIEPTDCVFEIPLTDFQEYFYATFEHFDYMPDENDFLNNHI